MPDINTQLSKPLGSGWIAEQGFTDRTLLRQLGAYKGRVASAYRAVKPEEMASIPPSGWVSPKLDGELWFLLLGNGEPCLVNPRGRVIGGNLELLKAAAQVKPVRDGITLVAGELYLEISERRSRVSDLAAFVAQGEAADGNKLHFAAFDVLPASDSPAPSFESRWQSLTEILEPGPHLRLVEVQEWAGTAALQTFYEDWVVNGGHEGIVVRARDGVIYKVKPSHTVDACVLGYTVKADASAGARSVLLGLMHPDGTYQVWGACGNLGDDASRVQWLQQLLALKVESAYRYASEAGALYTFVKPEIVVEVKVTDLLGERADGSSVQTMRLDFAGQWKPLRAAPMASPLHPVLLRRREDKSVNATDVRLAQIEPWLSAPPPTAAADELPASTLLRRQAWIKETKGKVAVRKLLVWNTNKEAVSPDFPAYVVHWTDYSSGRATPLEREVRLAPTEEEATRLAEAMIENNIKKGWVISPI